MDRRPPCLTPPWKKPKGRFRRNITSWERGDLLGWGSFGSVYEGISDDGFFFAVKEVSLLDQGSQGKQSIYQLEQEIALLSQFEHENIVKYYGTDKDESKLYIFLELVTKGSLRNIYQRYHLWDSQVSAYTRQILHGLKYLHDQNVVHRDIKCANILVDASGSVKLADFGLAKETKLNDVKSCKGTAFWMAPEVVNSKNQSYGLPADIWSLGCTVLEMLTRQLPYSGLECMQALFKIGRGVPPSVPDSLSNDARDFILQCIQVDPNDRPTAALLLDHPFLKRPLLVSSGSTNNNILLDAQNIQFENGVRDVIMVQTEVQSTEQELVGRREQEELREMFQEYLRLDDETNVLGGSSNGVRYTVPTSSREPNKAGTGGRDVRMMQLEARSMEQEIWGGGEQGNRNESWNEDLMQSSRIRGSLQGDVNHAHEAIRDTSETKLVANIWHGPRGVALLTTELVGQAFEEKKDEIWSQLMNDKVVTIGVCGMGGVGKTTLMKHVHNQLLNIPNAFMHVYWVTVSHDFSIFKLQNCISNAIKFDLSKEDDEIKRARKLHGALIRKKKFVLILDDLWNHFDMEKVGIPIRVNGCKLILTTRSWDICRQMCVCIENIIKVEPLSDDEGWTLFTKGLGNYNSELEPRAKAIAKECAGLPLAIRTMARSMRGVNDVTEWRNALEELKRGEKREGDMEPEVFRILRHSYNRLNDSTLQECFLYCALFPEDCEIKRDDLIEYWILEGMVRGKKNGQAAYDKCHDILNKLENACLLDGLIDFENFRCVKMHDLMRDMALQKLKEKSSVMVEASRRLGELPDMEEWTEDLVRVSLMKNDILEIPSGHSPRCPKLSTLLLGSNEKLNLIADSFFQQLGGLTILDLSYTNIDKLPDSISELVSLIALLLNNCYSLTHIPSLAKLKALKKLDLSFTECLEEVPIGMELVSNLKYLDLGESGVKELPVGRLPNLSHLQVLRLTKFYIIDEIPVTGVVVKGEEVASLRKLETLECYFESLSDFNKYMKSCKRTPSLSIYSFLVGQRLHLEDLYLYFRTGRCGLSKKIWLNECSISKEQDFVGFPEDTEELVIITCNVPRSLFDDFPLRCSTKLKYIYIFRCDGVKTLVSSSSLDKLQSLETLCLDDLENFSVFFSREDDPLLPFPYNGTFSHLRDFKIIHCHMLKRLFPVGLLSNLQNLETIRVVACYKMEEILDTTTEEEEEEEDDDDDDDDDMEEEEKEEEEDDDEVDEVDEEDEEDNSSSYNLPFQFSLPKLRILEFSDLPNLKRICSEEMICDSLQEIAVVDCPKLKRIPLSLPLKSLQRIQAYPKKWWESVEWGHLSDKNLLQPVFDDYVFMID